MSKPRVLVCGGRDYHNREEVYTVLDLLCKTRGWTTTPDEYGNWLPYIHIIAGEAKGADSLAKDYSIDNWTGYSGYPADWDKYGKRAGYIRNQQMLDEGTPDIVVAFPGGKGTKMMVQIAKDAGIEVIEVNG